MRRGQAAIEYLFMVAAALLIVLTVVRILGKLSKSVAEQNERTSREIVNILNQMTGSGESNTSIGAE
ncbi:class III signal peptide-containing protein [Thermococcus sp. MAR1]|uniref:class III signal peptide-containing protein n=1 Tax=Thermococcus sp. MAR1 TaxID=1638263 RepID=UPI00143A4D25|nr:class III signal peptide-containing protein [Thermococcus sp. MAR1]NJE09865.1 class III signal peptide-containing protein [Thermococcus sp. MAR1]